MERIKIKFNKVVNYDDDGRIIVLEYVFNDNDRFKGAVGSVFYPISMKEYKKRTTKKAVIEYLKDCFTEEEIKSKGGINNFYNLIRDSGEIEQAIFDTSYQELWDSIRKELNLNKKNAYIFDCVGGGRCFDEHFQGNINSELSDIIREYES
jgi:hypothetical protein